MRAGRSATFPLAATQQMYHDLRGHPRNCMLAIAGHFARVPAPDLVHAALRAVMARHDALRLVVTPTAYTQSFDDDAEPHVDVIEVDGDDATMRGAFANWYVTRPLSVLPHSGVAIFRRPDGSGYLVPWGHHAVLDGSSLTVLSNELAVTCARLSRGDRPPERRLPSYRDFVEWSASYAKSEECDADLAFWKSRYPEFPGSSMRRRGDDARRPATWDVMPPRTRIPADAYGRFRSAAQSAGGSTFDAVLLIVATIVGAFSGARVAHIMIPTLNRIRPFRAMVGMFMSNILVSVALDPDDTVGQAMHGTQQSLIAMHRHQRIAIPTLRDRGVGGAASGVDFDLILTFFPDTAQQLENTFDGVPCDDDRALRDPPGFCPLQVSIFEPGYRNAANVDVTYRPDYFRAEDAHTIGRAIRELAAAFAADPQIRVGDLLERAAAALAPALVTA